MTNLDDPEVETEIEETDQGDQKVVKGIEEIDLNDSNRKILYNLCTCMTIKLARIMRD